MSGKKEGRGVEANPHSGSFPLCVNPFLPLSSIGDRNLTLRFAYFFYSKKSYPSPPQLLPLPPFLSPFLFPLYFFMLRIKNRKGKGEGGLGRGCFWGGLFSFAK
jgi:hypothetical protein